MCQDTSVRVLQSRNALFHCFHLDAHDAYLKREIDRHVRFKKTNYIACILHRTRTIDQRGIPGQAVVNVSSRYSHYHDCYYTQLSTRVKQRTVPTRNNRSDYHCQ